MALKYKCPICNRELGYEGLCYICKAEKKRKEILSLNSDEIEDNIANILLNIEELNNWRSNEYKTLEDLICVRGIIDERIQRAAIKANIFALPKLYYHAPVDVRDEIINKLLNTEDSHKASKLQECLAMQGDEVALKTMYELEKNPKEWRKQLYVDPSIYAECGGWTFDKSGKRRELNYKKCYPLIKGNKEQKEKSPVKIGHIREDMCPHCGGKLVDMLTVDGRDERLKFLGIDGIVTATCCPNCVVMEEAAYSSFTLDGKSEVMEVNSDLDDDEENYMGDEGLKDLEDNNFILGPNEVSPFYETEGDIVNTIGGFASWVQDWIYTKCPKCGKTMKYLGQLHWGVLTDDEGTLYVEVCPECKVASMHHQQT